MNQMSLLIIELILCLTMLITLYKKYQNIGIYTYCVIVIILSSIMTQKVITLYDFDVNLGIIPMVSIFAASNILIQKNGQEDAKTLLLITIGSSLVGYIPHMIIFLEIV